MSGVLRRMKSPRRGQPIGMREAIEAPRNSGYTKPSTKTRIRRFYKKLPRPVQIIIGNFAVLVYLGMPWLTVEIGVFVLVAMIEFSWVAPAILIGMFLIALLPSNGWTKFGTYLFLIGVVVSAFFDISDILTFLYRLVLYSIIYGVLITPVSYTHLTLPTIRHRCRSRWSPYH